MAFLHMKQASEKSLVAVIIVVMPSKALKLKRDNKRKGVEGIVKWPFSTRLASENSFVAVIIVVVVPSKS